MRATILVTLFAVLAIGCAGFKTTGNDKVLVDHGREMFAKGVRNGCSMTQMKAMPFDEVSPENASLVDWEYCEKLYWEVKKAWDKAFGDS